MRNVIGLLFDADSLLSRTIWPLVYILLYDYIYDEYIYETFHYMGNIDYQPMAITQRLLWIIISLAPMYFYHRINEISTYICIFTYILVYIPFIHAFFVIDNIPSIIVYSYTCILCLFFCLYFQIDRIPVIKDLQIKPSIPLFVIEIVTIALTALFVISRAKSMHFVNIFTQIDLLYEFREQNNQEVGERSIFGYLQGWLTGAFFPFLLIWYLKYKSYSKAALVLLGYFLIFMVDMKKSTFLIPFILILSYYFIKLKEDAICNRLHSYLLLGLLLISCPMLLVSNSDNEVLFLIVTIILLRTICVTGWLTQFYIHFFQENPYTYYSHIGIVNAITHKYPYDVQLGEAVSYNSQNANATFFLTEGVASWGIIGVIITGIIFFLFLYFLNSISNRYQKTDLFIVFIPSMVSLLNGSFFATLLTGGLFFLLIIIGAFDAQEKQLQTS